MLKLPARLGRKRQILRRRLIARSATSASGLLCTIALIAALNVEFPLFGIIGWPAIVILAFLAVFVVATGILIPLAYAMY